MLAQLAACEFLKLSFPEAMELPFEGRKRVGLIAPSKFGTLTYPIGHEQTHMNMFGTMGAGRTSVMRALVKQAIERDESVVLFDLTGHYMEAPYKERRETVLNLNDKRCANWTIFNDCRNPSEYPLRDGAEAMPLLQAIEEVSP